ncbi:MAG: hypothetical protein ACI9MC_002111 [Kiritimatiellia bacterium]|jgi:hypothetical protein
MRGPIFVLLASSLCLGCEAADLPTDTDLDTSTETDSEVVQTDAAVLWRGVKHAWHDEVHRTGRFGNWVAVDTQGGLPREFSVHHLARTGTVKDTATFSVMYDVVQADRTRFVAGVQTLPIDTLERTTVAVSEHVVVPVSSDALLEGKSSFVALLNGFSLYVRDDELAKKLGTLQLRLSDPMLIDGRVEFDITGELYLSCASTECDLDEGLSRQTVAYDLDVHWLLVASEADAMHVIRHESVGAEYGYASKNPVPESLGELGGVALNDSLREGYASHTMGLRGFRFHVRKQTSVFLPDPVPHLFTWKMWGDVRDVGDGSLALDGQAFFAHSSNGVTNVGHKGHADLSYEPVTLQFRGGNSARCEWEDTQPFGNNSSEGVEAYERAGTIEEGEQISCP